MALLIASPALAEEDPAASEEAFRQCSTCHVVADDNGHALLVHGRNGPNLYGRPGRVAGGAQDFRHAPSLVAAGDAGFDWDAETFAD